MMIKFNPNQMLTKLFNNFSNGKGSEQAGVKQEQALQNRQSQQAQPSAQVNLMQSSGSSFGLFYKSVKSGVESSFSVSISQQSQMSASNGQVEELDEELLEQREERASLAANNILGFIGKRLELDKASGATDEELESRLAAGLAGFEKGYKEANQILKDMGMLNEEVEADIMLTNDKVRSGLNDIRESILPATVNVDNEDSTEASNQAAQSMASSASSIVSNFSESLSSFASADVGSRADNVNPIYSSIASSQSRTFQFELVTQDGDKVTIDASAFQKAYLEQGPEAFSSGVSSGSDFGFKIEGELDKDEVAAIAELLKDVNALASDFYSGDMSKALDKAMNLGFDSSEIGGFALNLSQVTQVKAMQAYQPNEQILKPDVLAELRPLGKFASQLSQMLTRADDQFSHPRQLLSDLFQQIDNFALEAQEVLEDPSANAAPQAQSLVQANAQAQLQSQKAENQNLGRVEFVAFSQSIVEQWSLRQSETGGAI
jgi:hypothetical protein